MQAQPAIACLILAAGRSTRMRGQNKLLELLAGKPLVRHVVNAALASRARPVIIVTGYQRERIRTALAGCNVTFVDNPSYASGLSTSLRAGLAALPCASKGVVVALADMPHITSADIDRLITAFQPDHGKTIVVPVRGGKRGNPVLFGADYFTEMKRIDGDTGARALIRDHMTCVVEVEFDEDRILIDVDTPEQLGRLRRANHNEGHQ
jgi:molybdenum cofactor cytidylyltransferase